MVPPPPPLRPSTPVPAPQGPALTAFLFVALVKTVGQPVALPGARDAPPIAAHEVARNVALVGEVVPREQLALCGAEGTERSAGAAKVARTRAPPPKALWFGMVAWAVWVRLPVRDLTTFGLSGNGMRNYPWGF